MTNLWVLGLLGAFLALWAAPFLLSVALPWLLRVGGLVFIGGGVLGLALGGSFDPAAAIGLIVYGVLMLTLSRILPRVPEMVRTLARWPALRSLWTGVSDRARNLVALASPAGREKRRRAGLPESVAAWFDRAHPPRSPRADYDAEPWERPAPRGSLREETNWALEEVRRHLGPVIRDLFVFRFADEKEYGPGWLRRLSERRAARAGALPIPMTGEPLGSCRVLFSVIEEDWPMIDDYFDLDPSPAARRLLDVLARYDNGGPAAGDPEVVTQAFTEILSAVRPEAREMVEQDFRRAMTPSLHHEVDRRSRRRARHGRFTRRQPV